MKMRLVIANALVREVSPMTRSKFFLTRSSTFNSLPILHQPSFSVLFSRLTLFG
jgi:hypothetical protein